MEGLNGVKAGRWSSGNNAYAIALKLARNIVWNHSKPLKSFIGAGSRPPFVFFFLTERWKMS